MEEYARLFQIGPNFRGVYSRDKLPKKVAKVESAIINLDSDSGPGSHWVCYQKEGEIVHYYDSFGVIPPYELIKYWGPNSIVVYNYEKDQEFNQVICGHLCLKFLQNSI